MTFYYCKVEKDGIRLIETLVSGEPAKDDFIKHFERFGFAMTIREATDDDMRNFEP